MREKEALAVAFRAARLAEGARLRPWTAKAARGWLDLAVRWARKRGLTHLAEHIHERGQSILN